MVYTRRSHGDEDSIRRPAKYDDYDFDDGSISEGSGNNRSEANGSRFPSTRPHRLKKSGRHLLDDSPNEEEVAALGSRKENKLDEDESIDQYEEFSRQENAGDEEDYEPDGLRRSSRKRKMKFETYNTNVIQDDYLGLSFVQERKSHSTGASVGSHSGRNKQRGQGVGKGGIKRDQHFTDSDKVETDMYSRVKRKRVRPAFYVEHDDASSMEYARYRKRSKKRVSRSHSSKQSTSTPLPKRPFRSARLRSAQINLQTSDEDDNDDRNRSSTMYSSRHSFEKSSSRSCHNADKGVSYRRRRVLSPSETELHNSQNQSDALSVGNMNNNNHQHNTRLSTRNQETEHAPQLDHEAELRASDDEDIDEVSGELSKAQVRRSGRVASKRGSNADMETHSGTSKSNNVDHGEATAEEEEIVVKKRDKARGSDSEDEEDDDDDDEDDEDEEDAEDGNEEEGSDENGNDNKNKQGRRYPMRNRRQLMPYLTQMAAKQNKTKPENNHKWNLSSPKQHGRFHTNNRRYRPARSSSSDSSSSSKSETRRHTRALPLNMKAKDFLNDNRRNRLRAGLSLADVDPVKIDKSVTFEAIGGNEQQIQALKESVLLPLLYPDVFKKLGIHPARGLLFHGPPGTGKTLLARALANECSSSQRKVAFFMRKGADCLSKWVGESERQLRLLFDEAYRMRPSIIFFDEIDGLAPVRSSRQDQIHSSIVSTLLGLIDGLNDRGEIIIIGATNRVDSIDPALRRPGRFDREFIFFPPDEATRKKILKIHSSKGDLSTSPLFNGDETLLDKIAKQTAGFTGADLRALVTEASLCAMRRMYPQVYSSKSRLELDASCIKVDYVDYLQAINVVQPTSQRIVAFSTKPLPPVLGPLLHDAVSWICYRISWVFPYVPSAALTHMDTSQWGNSTEKSLHRQLPEAVQRHPSIIALCHGSILPSVHTLDMTINTILYAGREGDSGGSDIPANVESSHIQESCMLRNPRLFLVGPLSKHLMPAVFHKLDKIPIFSLSVSCLHGNGEYNTREECMSQIMRQALRSAPAIVYLPEVDILWDSLTPVAQQCLLDLLDTLPNSPAHAPILILATSSQPTTITTEEATELDDPEPSTWKSTLLTFFSGDILSPIVHTTQQRMQFFRNLFQLWPFISPKIISQDNVDLWIEQMSRPLPEVEAPPPAPMSEKELRKLYDEEEEILRGMRMVMRHVINKLSTIRRFFIFSRAVDPEDVPDYYDVIKKPMDLNCILDNIDAHRYQTVNDFEKDLELIYQNALEYNPSTVPKSRDVRHRASDFLDVAFSLCRLMTAEMRDEYEQVHKSRAERAKHFTPATAAAGSNSDIAAAATTEPASADAIPAVAVNCDVEGADAGVNPTSNVQTPHHRPPSLSLEEDNKNDDSEMEKKNGIVNGHASGPASISSKNSVPSRHSDPPRSNCSAKSSSSTDEMEVECAAVVAKTAATAAPPLKENSSTPHEIIGVNAEQMHAMLNACVSGTVEWSAPRLEQLHTKLSQVINRYRYEWDRTLMIKDMEEILRLANVKV